VEAIEAMSGAMFTHLSQRGQMIFPHAKPDDSTHPIVGGIPTGA
jgi:hypothetical protein